MSLKPILKYNYLLYDGAMTLLMQQFPELGRAVGRLPGDPVPNVRFNACKTIKAMSIIYIYIYINIYIYMYTYFFVSYFFLFKHIFLSLSLSLFLSL